MNAERPGFIAPPTDPLIASMAKQKQIKSDIKELVNLTLADLSPNEKGLEAGLSYIGLVLERVERQLGKMWAHYEGSKPPTINYPRKYTIKSEEEILENVKALKERMFDVPSTTYKKAVAKKIAKTMLGTSITDTELATIYQEIESANVLTTDPNIILPALEKSILSDKNGAAALGLPHDDASIKQAQDDHAARAKRILAAQTSMMGARGVNDLSASPSQEAKEEKQNSQNPDLNVEREKKVRGPSNDTDKNS
jgi:hypothetical protein